MFFFSKGGNMKVRITATVVSLMLLTACSESSPQEFSSAPAPETSSSVETAATTVTSAEPAKETTTVQKKPAKKYKDIEADVVALEGDRLKFIFEGEEYDLPVSEGNLSGRMWGSSSKTLEEMIAGNRFGIPVKADIRVDEDMTQIKKIDIFKPNGRLINGTISVAGKYGTIVLYSFCGINGKQYGYGKTVTQSGETVNIALVRP